MEIWFEGIIMDNCCHILFQISYIDNIGHLCHLRVLNLAGNDIAIVEDLSTMYSLTELNLRRNRITHVSVS